jgi:hypothetical protein
MKMKKSFALNTVCAALLILSFVFCVAAFAGEPLEGTWVCSRDEGAGVIWTYRITFGGNSAILEERAGSGAPSLNLASYIVEGGTIRMTLLDGVFKGEIAAMPFEFDGGCLILTMDEDEEPYVFEMER